MTPPLTDAELLAYIERTPECATCMEQINPFNRGYWVHGSAGGYMPYKYKVIARAFHAHEQRVREEEREACAKLIEQRGELSAALAEVKRLNEWADGMTDAALKERQTGEMYQRELRAEIERLRQQQDELVWRVVVIFREELCDSLIGDAPPPTVSKIIARVRAEMEKEKNGN